MKPRSELARVFLLIRPFWGRIFGISLLIIVLSSLNQIPPLIIKSIIDILSSGKTTFFLFKTPTLVNLILLGLAIKLANTLINRVSNYSSEILGSKLNHYLRELGFRHLLRLSVSFYNRNQSGKIMNKISRGSEGVKNIVSNLGVYFLPGLITAFVSLIIVSRINWVISLLAGVIFIPYFYIRYLRFKSIEKISKKENRTWDREYSHFWEVISNIRLVKSFNAENYELSKLKLTTAKLLGFVKAEESVNNKSVASDFLIDIWDIAILGYICFLGLSGRITIGTIVLLLEYVQLIKQPLWNLSWIFWQVKEAQVRVHDYLKILDEKPNLVEINQPIHLPNPQGLLEFKNVWFKYPEKGGREVLDGVSFTIPSGKTLALVGKSGVGKTTIAHLVVRFFDPDKGKITIDGIDLRDLSFASLRHVTGLVMQENHLFDDTIINNLRYAKPNASKEEMEIACHTANAMEFIKKLPKGLNTVIGERGVRLSGGQKQRLSIARTILKNPKILVLDEATSALDSHSELLVQDALWKLIKGRTTIIIAHRLSTVQKADQIVVLDNKKVAEQGNHKELLKTNGIYASLHRIQSGNLTLKEWDLIS